MGSPFYSDGLSFECDRCSACCGGAPGSVFLTASDLRRLLSRLELDFPTFYSRYCALADTGEGLALSLAERPNFDCVFLGPGGCSVYDSRPIQCSAYPFWASILESERAWKREAAGCPGIGRGAAMSGARIEERLLTQRLEKKIIFKYGDDPETMDEDTILGS